VYLCSSFRHYVVSPLLVQCETVNIVDLDTYSRQPACALSGSPGTTPALPPTRSLTAPSPHHHPPSTHVSATFQMFMSHSRPVLNHYLVTVHCKIPRTAEPQNCERLCVFVCLYTRPSFVESDWSRPLSGCDTPDQRASAAHSHSPEWYFQYHSHPPRPKCTVDSDDRTGLPSTISV